MLLSRGRLGPRERRSREMGKNGGQVVPRTRKSEPLQGGERALLTKERGAQTGVQEHVRAPLQPSASASKDSARGFRWGAGLRGMGKTLVNLVNPEERGGSEPLPHPPLLPGLAGASCPSLTPLPPPLLSNSPILTPVVLLMVPKGLHGAKANHSSYPLFSDRRPPTTSLKPRPPDPLVCLLPPCHQHLRFSQLLSCYLGPFPGLGGIGVAQALTWGHSLSVEHLALGFSSVPLLSSTLVCSRPL